MKKSLIASLLGLVALAAVPAAHAQGNIFFCNYNFSASLFAPLSAPPGQAIGNEFWGNAFSVQLYYAPTSNPGYIYPTFTWGTAVGAATPFIGANPWDPGAGFFNGGTVTVPQSLYNAPTSGAPLAAYFRVWIYNTATVTLSGAATGVYPAWSETYQPGQLGNWSEQISCSTLATPYNLHLAGDLLVDNADVTVPMTGTLEWPLDGPPITVPEPSTLALAGLGGLGMLMALRRKKAGQ